MISDIMRRFIISTTHLIPLLTPPQKKTEISSTGKTIDIFKILAQKCEGKRPRETVWPSWKDYINLILKRYSVNVWCEYN